MAPPEWEVEISPEFLETFEKNMAPYKPGPLGSPPPLPQDSEKLAAFKADGVNLKRLGSEVLLLKKKKLNLDAVPQGPRKYMRQISFGRWTTYVPFQRNPNKAYVLPVVDEQDMNAAKLESLIEMARRKLK